jgi:hypothetical protein
MFIAEPLAHFLELEPSVTVSGLFHLLQSAFKVDYLSLEPDVLLVVKQTATRLMFTQTLAALFQQSFKVLHALGLVLGVRFGRYLFCCVWQR